MRQAPRPLERKVLEDVRPGGYPRPGQNPWEPGDVMATPRDPAPERGTERQGAERLGEGYFILGMAVQVGLVGLVGLALIGVQGIGFLSLGTAIALAGLAIGILAIGSILTLASLRHTLNVVYDQDDRIDRLTQRLGRLSEELGVGGTSDAWGDEQGAMEVPPPLDEPPRAREDPRERRPSPGPSSRPDPLEDAQTHAPVEVPGIDPEASERLAQMGVSDTRELWDANAMYVAGRLEADPEEVRRWQALARLMAIEGIDGDAADRLARAGVTSVEQLAHETPERLMRNLAEGETGSESSSIDPQQAHDWIQGARAHVEALSPAEGQED